jgi:hypothetical protein
MKRTLLLICCSLLLLNIDVNAQCNALLAGAFDQIDSCDSFSHSQTRTATVTAYSTDQIIISNFGSFLPPNDVFVVVDCGANTLTMYQTLGMTNVTGSGTFAGDYSSMTLNYFVDFGSSTMNCVAVYNRQTNGILKPVTNLQLITSPNPVVDHLNISVNASSESSTVFLFNNFGQKVYEYTGGPGQTLGQIDMQSFPAGIYNLEVCMGKDVLHKTILKK